MELLKHIAQHDKQELSHIHTHTHINRIPEAAQETNKLSGSFVGVFLHKHAAPAETCLKKVVFFFVLLFVPLFLVPSSTNASYQKKKKEKNVTVCSLFI